MFQRILVPLDGSHRAERAVPVAARIARSTGGAIVLLRVVTTPIELAWFTLETVGSIQRAIDADIARAKDYLTTISQADELASIETQIDVLPGEPALTIFTAASEHQADLIVMCSHGETGFRRWLVGSVTQKVARHSSIPVLVLCEDTNFSPHEGQALRIMVPLDGSPLAEAALAPATALSAAISAPAPGEIHLLHVISRSAFNDEETDSIGIAVPGAPQVVTITPRPIHQDEEQAEFFEARKVQKVSEAKAYLETVARRLGEGEVEGAENLHVTVTMSVVIDTDIADALITRAENGEEREEGEDFKGCDMIAMATHGRGGLGYWIMGSVTERILGATKLPLLIVRPHEAEKNEEMKETARQSQVSLP